MADLPNADDLMTFLFDKIFDIIQATRATDAEELSMSAQHNLQALLVTLVEEAASLSTGVLDKILAQFLRVGTMPRSRKGDVDASQTRLTPKETTQAYRAAAKICNECPDKMSRYVAQYFNEVVLESQVHRNSKHGRGAEDQHDENESNTGPSPSGLIELEKAHSLLRELWRCAHMVLSNVVPQVEAELSADNVRLRLMATETLGDMIAGIGSAGPPPPPIMNAAAYPPWQFDDPPTDVPANSLTTPRSPIPFSEAHHSAYQSFVGRQQDKSAVIRAAWVTSVGNILTTAAGGVGISHVDQAELVKALGKMLVDPEEKVRIAAIKAIGDFSLKDVIDILGPYGGVNTSSSVLGALVDRCKDVKDLVRAEALHVVSRLWGVAAGEIAAGNKHVVSLLDGIPTRVIEVFYANNQASNVMIDQVLYKHLIPLNYPPVDSKGKKSAKASKANRTSRGVEPSLADQLRTARILLFVRCLSARAKTAFFAILGRQKSYKDFLGQFLERCEQCSTKNASADARQSLDRAIRYILPMLPEPVRGSVDLQTIAKLNDRSIHQLLRKCINPGSDFNTVHAALERSLSMYAEKNLATAATTMRTILYRSSYLIYNRSHLPHILQYARSDDDGLGSAAHELLTEISQKDPKLFEASVRELCNSLIEQSPSASTANPAGSVETLKACAIYARGNHTVPADAKFIAALQAFALYGVPAKAAKYASSILLAASSTKEMHAQDLLRNALKDWQYGSPNFLSKLATISQVSHHSPESTEEFRDEILEIAINDILQKNRTSRGDEAADESTGVWVADADLDDECRAKCWAVKILVNGIYAIEDVDMAKSRAVDVLKLLNSLIANKGEISKRGDTPRGHCSRLYLFAAQSLLKLCRRDIFEKMVTPGDFESLALMAQDGVLEVRQGLVQKLQKYLVKNSLPQRFYTIFFLTAYEPSSALRQSLETWLRSRAKYFQQGKLHVLESVLPRLVSLLAHHPDYAEDVESLGYLTRYLVFYVSCVASRESGGLLYKYAERLKQVADTVDVGASERLYLLSEVAQMVIKKWEDKNGWSFQTWLAKVGMPNGLFGPLKDHATAQKIADKQYVPADVDVEGIVDSLVRDHDRKKVSGARGSHVANHTDVSAEAKVGGCKRYQSKEEGQV